MTFPLATLAAQVTPAGITAPPYSDILASLQASFQAIYGTDVYLGADSQDGQLLAIVAKAVDSANQACIAVYNSFSPTNAQGAGLSSLVQINGLTRSVASASQADLTIVGTVGVTLTNCQARDDAGHLWSIPTTTIPSGGTILVTATCTELGAIAAPAASITAIATPTFGWTSVTNAAPATLGDPLETDATLRQRQVQSVALPSTTILAGLRGALLALTGVSQAVVYENDTSTTDSNGIPEHSISCVVEGGNITEVGQTILARKTPGTGTYGSTTVVVHDVYSTPYSINFYPPTTVAIKAGITLHSLTGYSSAVADAIKQSVADYVNALPIGQSVFLTRLYLPALLNGDPMVSTYEIVTLQIGPLAGSLGSSDIAVAFNEQAALTAADVAITVV